MVFDIKRYYYALIKDRYLANKLILINKELIITVVLLIILIF